MAAQDALQQLKGSCEQLQFRFLEGLRTCDQLYRKTLQRVLNRVRPFLVEEAGSVLERIAQGLTGNCEKLGAFHM